MFTTTGRVALAVFAANALFLAPWLSQQAFAKDRCKDACWIDVKTGRQVPSVPLGGKHSEFTPGTHAEYAANDVEIGFDGKTAFNTKTKQNYAKEADGSWIDLKTGKCVPTIPLGGEHSEFTPGTHAEYAANDVEIGFDGKTAFNTRTKQNFARVPCPPPPESAGLQPPPSTSSTGAGFYAGLFVGGASHNATSLWFPNPGGFGADALPLGQFQRSIGDLSQPGFIGGGQVGYDMGVSFDGAGTSVSLVIGAAADFAGMTGDTTRNALFPSIGGGLFPIQNTFSTPFVTTERARVGLTAPVSGLTVTPYVTGGFAAAQVNFSDSMFFPTSFNRGSSLEFRPGWVVGGGVDIKIAGSPVTVQVQYLHTDFGEMINIAPNGAFPASFILTRHSLTQDRATIGINAHMRYVLEFLEQRDPLEGFLADLRGAR